MRRTKALIELEAKWDGKRVRCKGLRGAGDGKASWEEYFTGTVDCLHTDEAVSQDGWIRPTGMMEVIPDEMLYSRTETVDIQNVELLV